MVFLSFVGSVNNNFPFPFYQNNDGLFMCICDKHDNFVLAKTK